MRKLESIRLILLNIQAKSSDITAAPRRASAWSEARLVVDCAHALLLEANAPARRALGLPRPLRDPLPLDAAMPALQTLRQIAPNAVLTGDVQLTFWSAGGALDWRCRIERASRRGALKSRFAVTVLEAIAQGVPGLALAPVRAGDSTRASAGEPGGPPSPLSPAISMEAIARLAHELRAPVSAIVSAADVMADEHLGPLQNERYQGYIVGIRDTARHLLGVVEAMLTSPAGAIDQGLVKPGRGRARSDLGSAVREVAHGLGAMAEAARIVLDIELAAHLPPVAADRTALRQMIYNLLSNALRHAGPGARVTARTVHAASGEIWLDVEDNGPGIPPAAIERAFQNESPACVRAGLGLLLTRKLAESAGATLSLTSSPTGTRARITFLPRDDKCVAPRV